MSESAELTAKFASHIASCKDQAEKHRRAIASGAVDGDFARDLASLTDALEAYIAKYEGAVVEVVQ